MTITLYKTYFMTRDWERAYHIIGDHLFAHIFMDFFMFLKTADEALVQISGTNIYEYLHFNFGK